MKWKHARKGIIEGEIITDHGDFVDIALTNKVRMGYGDAMGSDGFRGVFVAPGQIIRTRKSLLEEII